MSILEARIVPTSSPVNNTENKQLSAVESENEQPEMSFEQQLQGEIEKNTDNVSNIESLEHQLVSDAENELPLIETLDSELADDVEAETDSLTSGNILPIVASVNALPQNVSNDTNNSRSDQANVKPVIANPQLISSKQSMSPATTSDNSNVSDVTEQVVADFDNNDLPDEALNNAAKNQSNQRDIPVALKQEVTEVGKINRNVSPLVVNNTTLSEPVGKSLPDSITQQLQINTPVNQKQWGAELTQRMSMMVSNSQQQVAELRLNPAHLGPLNVRIQIEDDKANISFVANNQLVKEAVEVALPRLKEQLQEQGLDLAHVDVSARNNEDSEAESASENSHPDTDPELSNIENELQAVEINIDASNGVSVFV